MCQIHHCKLLTSNKGCNKSSGLGTVPLYGASLLRPHTLIHPSFLGTGTIGTAHSLVSTFLAMPSFSRQSNSFPISSRMENGVGLGLVWFAFLFNMEASLVMFHTTAFINYQYLDVCKKSWPLSYLPICLTALKEKGQKNAVMINFDWSHSLYRKENYLLYLRGRHSRISGSRCPSPNTHTHTNTRVHRKFSGV